MENLQFVNEFDEIMEAYRVVQLMTRDIQVCGGILVHDNSHAWCIRLPEAKSSLLQASFNVKENCTVIDCTLNEGALNIILEREPKLQRFGFTVPNISHNERKKPGLRIIDCTLKNLDDLQDMLKIIDRWIEE